MDRRHGVVLCNPFGQEAIRCHRLFRVLGERLARAGYHVLRFDYFGTGDSDGEDNEGSLPIWVQDVLKADSELARFSGHADRSWFGLRLGATLAALASAGAREPPRRLVIWNPVFDGIGYLDELARAHVAARTYAEAQAAALAAPSGAPSEALGFPLGTALREQIGALSTASLAGCRAGRVDLIADPGFEGAAALEGAFRESGKRLVVRRIESRILWASNEALNAAIVPADALQAIVESFSATP